MTDKASPARAAEKAVTHTPGPWTHYDDAQPGSYHPQHKIQSRGKSIATVYCTRGDEAVDAANAAFIVRACNAHAGLVAALRDIAAFDDKRANAHLEASGSYSSFDEPCSVSLARAALLAAKE